MIYANDRIAKRTEEIALLLTNTLSVVDTAGEWEIAQVIYDFFSQMPYYQEHPEDLTYVETGDELGRRSVLAILRGQKPSKKTIVTIGHIDTVGISDYGNLAHLANQPQELMEALKELDLSDQVRQDLESGDYLCGRGIFDMKSGDAILMTLFEELAQDLENFEGNLIFAAVCDEESNSSGMLTVLPRLVELQEKEGLDYLALLDTDYMTSEYEGDPNRYIYLGTVGKLMPSFLIVGKETHVGEAFGGLDPNALSSAILKKINMNTDYCDLVEGEASLPPISLYQRDQKTEYSVQTAKSSVLYFNYATHESTPDVVIEKMKGAAQEAFEELIEELNKEYKKFCDLGKKIEYKELPWRARVRTYKELLEEVAKDEPQLGQIMAAYEADLLKEKDLDTRLFAQKMVEKAQSLWKDQDPVVVVYLSPPYYPHIYVDGANPKDQALIEAVDQAVETTKTDYQLVYKKFFPYISDLSYAAAPKDPAIVASLKENIPGFGTKYQLPLEDMQKLSLPVVNIGSYGHDAHQFTERVERDYSYRLAPELVYKTIIHLLKDKNGK